MVNEMAIDSNTFYRITNSVLGTGFSLDVVNPAGSPPTGLVDITPSGLFSGQVWQFINPTKPNPGLYFLSSSFLGAEKKLDISVGANQTYIPFLKNFTAIRDQTWIVKPHNDTLSGVNTTTYSLEPTYFDGSKALTANSTTKQPFLDVPGGGFQHWVLTPVMQINDASFSTSALWAMATKVSLHVAILRSILTMPRIRPEQQQQRAHLSNQRDYHLLPQTLGKHHQLPYPNQPSSRSY
jgi:hypothetical protein